MLAAHADLDARVHLGIMAIVLAVVGQAAARRLPAALPAHDPPRLAWPPRPVLLIGVVGFCAVFAEGASADWCAVYLRDVMGTSAATAAAAYAGFALAMATGRLTGDRVVARFGAVATVRAGAVAATAGALVIVVARTPLLGIPGFALIGLGIATVVPLAFAAGGRAVPHAGQGIAAVATVAYGAGLAAPGAIGAIADVSSLQVAFVVVATLTALFGLGAEALRHEPRVEGRLNLAVRDSVVPRRWGGLHERGRAVVRLLAQLLGESRQQRVELRMLVGLPLGDQLA